MRNDKLGPPIRPVSATEVGAQSWLHMEPRAQAMGHEHCTSTQFRHPTFKRFRTKSYITRQVFVDFDERAVAKDKQCRWDAVTKMWIYDVPTEDATAALDVWIRARLEPPPMTWLRVPFQLRSQVNSLGAQWDGDSKRWYWGRKTPLPEGLSRFVADATTADTCVITE